MKMNINCTASELLKMLKEMDDRFDKTVLDNVFVTLTIYEEMPMVESTRDNPCDRPKRPQSCTADERSL